MGGDTLPLSTTSSLVLLWAADRVCQTRSAREYLSHLDLSAGQSLYEACNAIWPDYHHVIECRKRCVRRCLDVLMAGGKASQVAIAGAGYDPLCLDAAEMHPEAHIYDIDAVGRDEKRLLVDKSCGVGVAARIHFVQADLTDIRALKTGLTTSGWRWDEPGILIIEGVSYYLPRNTVRRLCDRFRPTCGRSRVVLEYLAPPDEITQERRYVPSQVFGLIARECGLASIQTLSVSEIMRWKNTSVEQRYRLHDIEREETGENRVFPSPDSGWIEVAVLGLDAVGQLHEDAPT